MSRIRPIALCLFRHGDRFLVAEDIDPFTQSKFCRPLGGGIEFGESSAEAVVREIREELALELVRPVLLGVLENCFEYNGQARHEIVFIYDGRLADAALYQQSVLPGNDNGQAFLAVWKTLAKVAQAQIRLTPAGVDRFLLGAPSSETQA